MEIYKDELAIAELILENNSIAYYVDIEPLTEENTSKSTLASVFDKTPNTDDLYFVKSILVTTNKNKNDDVFLPTEVWRAKATPVDKMWNIEHDHKRIVGHITSTWAVDNDLNPIEDSVQEDALPEIFHLISAGVIYSKWTDEDLQAQANQLIEEIEDGQWKTSMEARFSDFSFAAYKDNEFKIIERNEATAFLTKKLRCYGGKGVHDGYTLGRVLKNINFCGNSLVKIPANPDSVILAKSVEKKEKIIVNSKNNGVYVKCSEENEMSDVLEKQVAELKDALKSVQAENKELANKLASANTEKLEQENTSLREQLSNAEKDMEEMKKKKKSMEDASAALTQELENVKAEYEKVKENLETIKTEAVKAARIRQLQDIGLNDVDAKAKAESLAGLSKEQFDVVASTLSLLKTSTKAKESDEDNKAAKASSELENSEEESSDLDTTASDNDSESDRVKELLAVVATHYGDKLSKENK